MMKYLMNQVYKYNFGVFLSRNMVLALWMFINWKQTMYYDIFIYSGKHNAAYSSRKTALYQKIWNQTFFIASVIFGLLAVFLFLLFSSPDQSHTSKWTLKFDFVFIINYFHLQAYIGRYMLISQKMSYWLTILLDR